MVVAVDICWRLRTDNFSFRGPREASGGGHRMRWIAFSRQHSAPDGYGNRCPKFSLIELDSVLPKRITDFVDHYPLVTTLAATMGRQSGDNRRQLAGQEIDLSSGHALGHSSRHSPAYSKRVSHKSG